MATGSAEAAESVASPTEPIPPHRRRESGGFSHSSGRRGRRGRHFKCGHFACKTNHFTRKTSMRFETLRGPGGAGGPRKYAAALHGPVQSQFLTRRGGEGEGGGNESIHLMQIPLRYLRAPESTDRCASRWKGIRVGVFRLVLIGGKVSESAKGYPSSSPSPRKGIRVGGKVSEPLECYPSRRKGIRVAGRVPKSRGQVDGICPSQRSRWRVSESLGRDPSRQTVSDWGLKGLRVSGNAPGSAKVRRNDIRVSGRISGPPPPPPCLCM